MQVKISDECVGCGICEAINSYVFLVDSIAKVNKNEINQNKQDCIDAALICPVNAIWIDDISWKNWHLKKINGKILMFLFIGVRYA